MARTVQLACARCGHQQMYVVESTENGEDLAEAAGRETDADAIRLRRLEALPRSLPVGGIITPV